MTKIKAYVLYSTMHGAFMGYHKGGSPPVWSFYTKQYDDSILIAVPKKEQFYELLIDTMGSMPTDIEITPVIISVDEKRNIYKPLCKDIHSQGVFISHHFDNQQEQQL